MKLRTECSCSAAVYRWCGGLARALCQLPTQPCTLFLSSAAWGREGDGKAGWPGQVLSSLELIVPEVSQAWLRLRGDQGGLCLAQGSSRLPSQGPQPCCWHFTFLWLGQRLSTSFVGMFWNARGVTNLNSRAHHLRKENLRPNLSYSGFSLCWITASEPFMCFIAVKMLITACLFDLLQHLQIDDRNNYFRH